MQRENLLKREKRSLKQQKNPFQVFAHVATHAEQQPSHKQQQHHHLATPEIFLKKKKKKKFSWRCSNTDRQHGEETRRARIRICSAISSRMPSTKRTKNQETTKEKKKKKKKNSQPQRTKDNSLTSTHPLTQANNDKLGMLRVFSMSFGCLCVLFEGSVRSMDLILNDAYLKQLSKRETRFWVLQCDCFGCICAFAWANVDIVFGSLLMFASDSVEKKTKKKRKKKKKNLCCFCVSHRNDGDFVVSSRSFVEL
jgi:hypothetical protein